MVTAALLVVVLRVWSLVINVYLFKPVGSDERNKYLCNTVLQVLSVRVFFLCLFACMCMHVCACVAYVCACMHAFVRVCVCIYYSVIVVFMIQLFSGNRHLFSGNCQCYPVCLHSLSYKTLQTVCQQNSGTLTQTAILSTVAALCICIMQLLKLIIKVLCRSICDEC